MCFVTQERKRCTLVTICSIKPLADALVGALRELGHEPVAPLAPRRDDGRELPPHLLLTDASAPAGVDLRFARDKHAIEPLLRAYEPDLWLWIDRAEYDQSTRT